MLKFMLVNETMKQKFHIFSFSIPQPGGCPLSNALITIWFSFHSSIYALTANNCVIHKGWKNTKATHPAWNEEDWKSHEVKGVQVPPPPPHPTTFCLAFYPSGCYLSQLTFAISSIILKNCSHISKLWLCFQLLVKRVPSLMCKRWLYRGNFHLLTLASAFRCRWVICRTRISICQSICVLHELWSWSDTKKVAQNLEWRHIMWYI